MPCYIFKEVFREHIEHMKRKNTSEGRKKRVKRSDNEDILKEMEIWTSSRAHMELDRAAKRGDLKRYVALIETGETFDHIDFSYKLLLTEKHLVSCASSGYADLVDYLISKRGADVNKHSGRDDMAPIHRAAVGGKIVYFASMFHNSTIIIVRSCPHDSRVVTPSCECERCRYKWPYATSFECDVWPCRCFRRTY